MANRYSSATMNYNMRGDIKMKQYVEVEMEVIAFETEDVILTSCEVYEPGCPEYGCEFY